MIEREDAKPCPKCGSRDLDFLANVVECLDCGHYGPSQPGPEVFCDWRKAIEDWNMEAAQ